MADDELPNSEEPERKKLARPLSAHDLKVQAFKREQAENKQRADAVLEKHGDKIRSDLEHRHLIDDEPLLDAATEKVAQHIAERKADYPQFSAGDLNRIYETALCDAAKSPEKTEDRAGTEKSDGAEVTDAKLARNSDNTEMTDAKAQRAERAAQFEATMKEITHNHNGRNGR